MSEYTPDRWVVLEIVYGDGEVIRKVFAGWYGGYTGNDSWKLNSGITQITKVGDVYEFTGYSGSVYRCHTNTYGLSGYMASVLARWEAEAKKAGQEVEINIIDLEDIIVS